jgi:toxin ParE1/3/4
VPGLGDDFIDEVESGIRTILLDPTVWRVLEDDVRRFLIRRFPYGIYYTLESEVVVIWAIKHLHRDPDYWQDRRG